MYVYYQFLVMLAITMGGKN